MSLASKLLSASGGGADPLWVDSVFACHTYTGNGSTQTITNGIDLAGKGGLVWCRTRNFVQEHVIADTSRGLPSYLASNSTAAAATWAQAITSFNSNGFTLGTDNTINRSGYDHISWTFRKAPKFFDVVTYTGNGVAGRQIPHALGIAPGMVIVKCTSDALDWIVYHKNLASYNYMMYLNLTSAQELQGGRIHADPSSSSLSLGDSNLTNGNGKTYVAYLFAHDTSADGIVQCGSFTTNGSNAPLINLGWEPQYVLLRPASFIGNWLVWDTARGFSTTSVSDLYPNLSNAEATSATITRTPNAKGFQCDSGVAGTWVYLAIRRPNKPPTLGTQVYNAIARTGTGAVATVTGVGFAPDLAIISDRLGGGGGAQGHFFDRLRGPSPMLNSYSTAAETATTTEVLAYQMDGVSLGSSNTGATNTATWGDYYINHFFKRAPGVFDVVCYTGTGVAKTEAHSLGVVPELMIVKRRDVASSWVVYHAAMGATKAIFLEQTSGPNTGLSFWNDTAPAASVFTVGTLASTNGATNTFVAYLFATKAGISKISSYVGNGTSQTIDCGFTTGARFFMVKRTDAAGDWYVFDTTRGIISGNDGHLSLNTTAAEVTTNDSVDPTAVGIVVNQLAATNINVTSATYIYLAFA